MTVENDLQVLTSIEELKDKFREAKIRVGDLKGLGFAQRMALSEKFGIPSMQTLFYSFSGNGDTKIEVYADICFVGSDNSWWEYNMRDLIECVKDGQEYEITMYYCKWNKQRTDADRQRVNMRPFIFKAA